MKNKFLAGLVAFFVVFGMMVLTVGLDEYVFYDMGFQMGPILYLGLGAVTWLVMFMILKPKVEKEIKNQEPDSDLEKKKLLDEN